MPSDEMTLLHGHNWQTRQESSQLPLTTYYS